MRIVKASAEIEAFTPNLEAVIERAARTCYKSEDRITPESAAKFIRNIIAQGHESVLEHGSITVRFIVDRGVSHELVRHRLASISQESTRYCNYSKDKFGNEITVIEPCFLCRGSLDWDMWRYACATAETAYKGLLGMGRTPQEARGVLPMSLKTELVMTANPREFRHIFRLRCARSAHPQMREVMVPLLQECARRWPALFGDLLP